MERNAALVKAINAVRVRDDRAKLLLYDVVDAPVAQSFYDMLDEEDGDEASSEGSELERRLTYVKRNHPQVYSYRDMRCDGPQLRDAILDNNNEQFWFSVCLRCLGPRRDLPRDHNWKSCRGCCFFCLSYAHLGQPCPGPLRRLIDDVRQVIALEPPGLDWYERMAMPQTPPRGSAPVIEARADKVVQDAEKPEVISLLSSSPSSDGRGGAYVRDESKLAAEDEQYIYQDDQPQSDGFEADSLFNDIGQQEPGAIPIPSHAGNIWSTDEMETHCANQSEIATYMMDSEDEHRDQQEDDYGPGEATQQFQAYPYESGLHCAYSNDFGQQALGSASRFPPLSSAIGNGQEVAESAEWAPVMRPRRQEDCALYLPSDGPESPQTIIDNAEQRGCTDNGYDADGSEAEDSFSETDMEDEEVDFVMDEDVDAPEVSEDEEGNVEMEEEEGMSKEGEAEDDMSEEEEAEANDSASNTAEVVDLTSSSPPPESTLHQHHIIEPQPILQDKQTTSIMDQAQSEGTRSQPPAAAFDNLPTAERDNPADVHVASDIPSSDTVMADDGDVFESFPAQSNLGTRARDSLSPLRECATHPLTTLGNMATSDTDVELGQRHTFASARDSMTLYSGMPRGTAAHGSGAVSNASPHGDASETRSLDAGTRQNTPPNSTNLIQPELEVERQKADARDHGRQDAQLQSIDGPDYFYAFRSEGIGSRALHPATQDGSRTIQLPAQREHQEVGGNGSNGDEESDVSEAGGVLLGDYDDMVRFHEGKCFQRPSSAGMDSDRDSDGSANDDPCHYNAERLVEDTETQTEEGQGDSDGSLDFEDHDDVASIDQEPPSPTPTDLHEQQQAVDFAQAYLRHPSSLAAGAGEVDEETPSLDSCLRLLPCRPPHVGHARHAILSAAPASIAVGHDARGESVPGYHVYGDDEAPAPAPAPAPASPCPSRTASAPPRTTAARARGNGVAVMIPERVEAGGPDRLQEQVHQHRRGPSAPRRHKRCHSEPEARQPRVRERVRSRSPERARRASEDHGAADASTYRRR